MSTEIEHTQTGPGPAAGPGPVAVLDPTRATHDTTVQRAAGGAAVTAVVDGQTFTLPLPDVTRDGRAYVAVEDGAHALRFTPDQARALAAKLLQGATIIEQTETGHAA